MPCFGGIFQLNATNTAKEVEAIMGNQEISSDHLLFNKYAAKLIAIQVINK